MGMTPSGAVTRPAGMYAPRMAWPRWMVAGFIAIAVVVALAMIAMPDTLVNGDTIFSLGVVTGFILLLCVGLGTSMARHLSSEALVFRMALLIWWYVLICEVLFDHVGDSYRSYAGSFAPQVYGEGAIWLLAFAAVIVLGMRQPGFVRQLLAGDYKWVVALTAVSLISINYAPSKMYALGWGFKLLLCVLLVRLAGSLMRNPDDIVSFLKANVWAFMVLSVGPVVIAFSDPATAFDGVGGRLNADPDLLSAVAAYLLILGLVLNALSKKKVYLFLSLLGAAIMFLALGKAGVLAGIFASALFLLMQKKVAKSITMLLAVSVVGLGIIAATPLGEHLRNYEGAATFTGRTVIWQAAYQRVRERPVLGHGYLASYFAWVGNELDLQHDVTHLESSYMDLAYNEGVIGLGLMLLLHWIVVRNLLAAIRNANTRKNHYPGDQRANQIQVLSVGMLSLWVALFLVSLVISSIGARPMSPYMLFLGVFVVAAELRRLSENELLNESRHAAV